VKYLYVLEFLPKWTRDWLCKPCYAFWCYRDCAGEFDVFW